MKNDHLTPRDSIIPQGSPAPDFTLLDQDRKPWHLAEAVRRGPVVLGFYPMAFTSVCGTEMCAVRGESERLHKEGVQFVGISADSFAVQKAWSDQEKFTHPLLADMHRQVCRAYGLYWPDLNVASRGTVVVRQGQAGPVVAWSEAREVMHAMELDRVLEAAGV